MDPNSNLYRDIKHPPETSLVIWHLNAIQPPKSSSQHNTGHQYGIKYPQGEALYENVPKAKEESEATLWGTLTRSSAQEADRHTCTIVLTYLDRISRNWVLYSFGCHDHAQGKISDSLCVSGYRHRDPTHHHVGVSNGLHLQLRGTSTWACQVCLTQVSALLFRALLVCTNCPFPLKDASNHWKALAHIVSLRWRSFPSLHTKNFIAFCPCSLDPL